MGTQTWVSITIIITELLIVLKFDWDTIAKPFPTKIAACWIVFISSLALWTLWQFYFKEHLFSRKPEKEDKKSKDN
jgi:phosphatidylserine synthase 2